jgi:cyclopropane fatty-acyl-phospholipid synthase-like methyltransferase
MSKNEYLNYWNTLYSKNNYFGEGPTKLAKLAEKLFQEKNTQKILEVGCGQGRDAIYFSQLGLDVHAFDLSSNAIQSIISTKQKMNLNKLNVFEHNVTKPLTFPDEHFDFVYSNLALQFFELKTLSNILQNISKVMQKNSTFLLSTKKEGDKYYKTGKKISDIAYETKGITRYFHPIDDLKSIFSEQFKISKIDSDRHENFDSSVSVWWKIILEKN